MKKLVRFPNGDKRHEVNLNSLDIPDLWHVAEYLRECGEKHFAEMVIDCWYLTHDLCNHAIDVTPDEKPETDETEEPMRDPGADGCYRSFP